MVRVLKHKKLKTLYYLQCNAYDLRFVIPIVSIEMVGF